MKIHATNIYSRDIQGLRLNSMAVLIEATLRMTKSKIKIK